MRNLKKTGQVAVGETVDALLMVLYYCCKPITIKSVLFGMPYEYNIQSIRNCFGRLYAQGKIHKLEGKRGWFTVKKSVLTTSAIIGLKQAQYTKPWDGQWRMLMYDIAEKNKVQRELFRGYIKRLGFAKVQDSCWVSPYDYADELIQHAQKLNIVNSLCLYKGSFYAGKNIDRLVEEVWALQDIVGEYQSWISDCQQLCDLVEANKDFKDGMCQYSLLYARLQDIIERDPFLPDAFFKRNQRTVARKELECLQRALAKKIVIA